MGKSELTFVRMKNDLENGCGMFVVSLIYQSGSMSEDLLQLMIGGTETDLDMSRMDTTIKVHDLPPEEQTMIDRLQYDQMCKAKGNLEYNLFVNFDVTCQILHAEYLLVSNFPLVTFDCVIDDAFQKNFLTTQFFKNFLIQLLNLSYFLINLAILESLDIDQTTTYGSPEKFWFRVKFRKNSGTPLSIVLLHRVLRTRLVRDTFLTCNVFLYLKGKDFWLPAKVLHHQIVNFFADNLSPKISADPKLFCSSFEQFLNCF